MTDGTVSTLVTATGLEPVLEPVMGRTWGWTWLSWCRLTHQVNALGGNTPSSASLPVPP